VRGREGASGKVPVAAHAKRKAEYFLSAATNAGARSVRRLRDSFWLRPLLYPEVSAGPRGCRAAYLTALGGKGRAEIGTGWSMGGG